MDIQILKNKYSHLSYREIKANPMGEYFVGGKIYLKCGTTFPPDGNGYTELFDIETGLKFRMDHNENETFLLHGVKLSWLDSVTIPKEVLADYPVFKIKKQKAHDYATNPKSSLVCIHKWNEYWYLLRYPECWYRNIYSGDLVSSAEQLTLPI